MQRSQAWQPIAEGGKGLLLAVDFAATGRPEAAFTDLAAGLAGWEVWETVQPPIGTEDRLDAAAYVERWTGAVPGGPVVGVLGFCAGGVFAGEIAEALASAQQRPPRLLLFDPEAPTTLTLYYQFHKVVESLSGLLGPDRVTEAVEAGRAAQRRTDDTAVLGAVLVELFENAARPAFEAAELDEEYRAELTGTYRSFVSYLVAASRIDHARGWAPGIAFTSASPTSGLNPMPPEVRESLVHKELRFDTGHSDLLRDPDVARAAVELLT
ncbi:MAG: hypothetical protein ABWY11_12615 [Umezawaea sp.]